jgi:hypothetical protein
MAGQSTDHTPPVSALGAFKDVFKFYEDGKGRRYGLLFAVNGGALAIIKGVGETKVAAAAAQSVTVAGIGMILFVLIMTFDIWTFAERMRGEALKFGIKDAPVPFGRIGKAVLLLNALLLTLLWLTAPRL